MSSLPPIYNDSSVPPTPVLPFNDAQPQAIRLYPLSNYTFSVKETQPEEDPSVKDRLKRLEEHYEQHGMRRTCEAVLVCHEHNHPHVLMLQIANAFFKLPGDYILPHQSELAGLKARLDERLAPAAHTNTPSTDWQIHSTLSQWWRPNFETFMYPYLPPHITRPKESKKLYLIQLPQHTTLCVPKNMKLLAVPLFELYDNTQRYGPQLSALPHYLSRMRWEFVNEEGKVEVWTPGAGEGVGTKVLAGGEGGDVAEDVKVEGHEGTNGDVNGDWVKVENENDEKMHD